MDATRTDLKQLTAGIGQRVSLLEAALQLQDVLALKVPTLRIPVGFDEPARLTA